MELTITKDNFDADVLNSDIPVLVDFYADWCGPCKMMAPVVAEIAKSYEGRLNVGKCNIDNDAELAMKYRIMSIPAIMVFKGGEAVMTSIGAIPKSELEGKIQEVL